MTHAHPLFDIFQSKKFSINLTSKDGGGRYPPCITILFLHKALTKTGLSAFNPTLWLITIIGPRLLDVPFDDA